MAGAIMEMREREFEEFRSLIYGRSGIALGEGKQALVGARVGKRMRHLGLQDFGSYLEWVKGEGGEEEMVRLLDAISTNVTSFFREPAHFDFLRGAFGRWVAEGRRRFRFWSAACSTGEEPYTLAMALSDCRPPADCDIRILATDLSTRVLKTARAGLYAGSRLRGVPPDSLARHFTRPRTQPDRAPEDGAHEVSEGLRRMVLFRRLNLAFPPFPMQGPMDAILCRNVMIYFDGSVRERLVAEFHRLLKPGGFLLVGHTESLTGVRTPFRSVRPAVYVKDA